jgi:hypothetical protein
MEEITIVFNNKTTLNAKYKDLIKIKYFQQLFKNRTYDEIKEINFTHINIKNENMKIILDYSQIDNDEIEDYMNSIEQVSAANTERMPFYLYQFLALFNITDDKDYNKEIIEKMLSLKEDGEFLRYESFCDVIEYKWADNYRVMDKTILKEILMENVEDIYENEFKNKEIIDIKSLDYKYLAIIFNYCNVNEDKMDNFFINNIITDETIYNLINITTISNSKFKNILSLNINKIIDDLH